MAEDRQPGSADQPEDEPGGTGDASTGGSTPAGGGPTSPNSGYRLGGGSTGGSGSGRGSGSEHGEGQQPPNPFEALFSSLGGAGGGAGDVNALMQQLQNAFSMLGGAGGGGGLFGHGAPDAGSGVNWEVTKDTARKMVASLGPDPTPTTAQQHAVTEAASIAEVWLD